MQRIPNNLVVDAQVKAAGVEAGVAEDGQPGESDDVKQDQAPGEKMGELKELVGT